MVPKPASGADETGASSKRGRATVIGGSRKWSRFGRNGALAPEFSQQRGGGLKNIHEGL
jgi:hypothetical protein